MSLKNPKNHCYAWSDLLKDLDVSWSSSWMQIVIYLYKKEHGYSNYEKCQMRSHKQVRDGVYMDKRIQRYLSNDDFEGNNKRKIRRILDEMCHLLASENPSRRLKIAGTFFLKCITSIYSNVYVNNHLSMFYSDLGTRTDLFKSNYLDLTKEFPVVILPTHRSYMDFLFISYIMTHYELPLPIVATGDNFKAMGKFMTDYLKSTGAFLLRRTAGRRTDVEANLYYDILRAYVHSILIGGEHPLEFFMEGTRTRVGQVLKPKTGLLSMIVDAVIEKVVPDVIILPVAINYQRPIEEQLYIGENTPQINMRKPKESTTNLISGFNAIMKRRYGKVYVRFFEPFTVSTYLKDWMKVTGTDSIENGANESILHNFTNSLASKVCLDQVSQNILMPFNLLSCSILFRSFMERPEKSTGQNGSMKETSLDARRLPLEQIVSDFDRLEELLRATQLKFVPGWESRREIIDEFQLDRDGIVRTSEDRKFIEFNHDALTFQTLLYYSNQVTQVLLPVAICFILPLEKPNEDASNLQDLVMDEHCWEEYKEIRTLLSHEFFANESFMSDEFVSTWKAIYKDYVVPTETRRLLTRHLRYFVESYLNFFNYMIKHQILDKNEFFESCEQMISENQTSLYISKDMLRNMINLAKDHGVVDVEQIELPRIDGDIKRRPRREDKVTVKNVDKLNKLIERFEWIRTKAIAVISN